VKVYINHSKFKRENATGFSKNFDGSVNEIGINSKINYKSDDFVSFGIEQKKFKHKNNIDNSYKNQALFITNTNIFSGFIGGETILNESVRYDRFDSFKNKLTYKVGFKHIHKKIEGLWSSLNYATGYNVPTLYQLYDSYAGNKNLNPQKTKGLDININYKGMEISYFNNRLENIIDYNFATSKYANIEGKNSFRGVEFSYSGTVEDLVLLYSLNYTYLQAKDKDNKTLPLRAKNSANFSFDYYGSERTHIGLLIKFVGKREKSAYDINPDKKYPSFTVVDLSADYKMDSKLSLNAKIDNLLNKKYQQISTYATSERAFYLGFRYRLK